MELKKLNIQQLTDNIERYYLDCIYRGRYEVGISFLYHNKHNVIIPNHIFFRDIFTSCGGTIYKNSKEEIYNDYMKARRKDFPELCIFSRMILEYIDEYCEIRNPEVIYDLKRVKANP